MICMFKLQLDRENLGASWRFLALYGAMPYQGRASPWIRTGTENEKEHEVKTSYWCCIPCCSDDVWRYRNKEIWSISEEEQRNRWEVHAELMRNRDEALSNEQGEDEETAAKAELVKQNDEASTAAKAELAKRNDEASTAAKAELAKKNDEAPEHTR